MIDCGIVEVLASHKDPYSGLWLLMGRQYCFNGTEDIHLQCEDCPDTLTHYIIDVDGTSARLRYDYGVVVDEFKDTLRQDRQKFAMFEHIGQDETTDFIGQVKENLGLEIGYYRPDIATDPDVEKALGYG